MPDLRVVSSFQPAGDQPAAIRSLTDSLQSGAREVVLLGVTGSGKTYTVAKVFEQLQRPVLVIAHNKTLAAQLCSEFQAFFPDNAVEYFVSYYDYYQPEAYVASSDTFIEKDVQINEEIDKLRHSATCALFERKDVIIVASVSCIYGLGSPDEYRDRMLSLREGMVRDRDDLLRRLVDIQYQRNEINFVRGTFRARGDVVEIFPAASNEKAVRVEMFGDEIERLLEFNPLTGEIFGQRHHIAVYPARHYVTSDENMLRALKSIENELKERLAELRGQGKLVEAQRLEQRTNYDLEMLAQVGYCAGIENYSRHLTGRQPGDAPYTLIDFFPEDFLIVIDESHVTLPQVRAMYHGDRARKQSLVDYGFRLPSAFDNRPLTFQEFEQRIPAAIYVSATPGPYELERATRVVEQIVRPTGLTDPMIEVRPTHNQVDDLVNEARLRSQRDQRVLVTTLTKRMAEDLTEYMREAGLRVRYLHSEIHTLERMQILRDLRLGTFDILVGINLLREGLDLPEVTLVAILDADKEGFLRSETSLVQTTGRAARNVEGRVIMYADTVTQSMRRAMAETDRRRQKQVEHNQLHNITPETIKKAVREVLEVTRVAEQSAEYIRDVDLKTMDRRQAAVLLKKLKKEMKEAAKRLEYEHAATLRDMIFDLQERVSS